jgi:plastin-1
VESSTKAKGNWLKVMAAVKSSEGKPNIFKIAKRSDQNQQDVVHSYSQEEKAGFSEHMNLFFGDGDGGYIDEMQHLLPIDPESDELFTKIKDGKLLCKLINAAVEDTVDERALNMKPKNPWQYMENLNIVVEAARAIGCHVVNVGSEDLLKGNEILILGVVWQIVRMQLTSDITLAHCPFLVRLLEDGEELADLMALTPEQLLLRWFNYHLKEAGTDRRVRNFGGDLKDGQAYSVLLNQLRPDLCIQTGVQRQIGTFRAGALPTEMADRATNIIATGRRMGVKAFLRPADICKGNQRLNLAFVAQIFNCCPGLKATDEEVVEMAGLMGEDEDAGDSREERSFRMWLNSLNLGAEYDADGKLVREPIHVNNLFADACDGLIILYALDKVHPGSVHWKWVNLRRPISKFKAIENCNYAVTVATGVRYSMVNIGGLDINRGSKKLILGLVWQMMRCHLLQILSSLTAPSSDGKGGVKGGTFAHKPKSRAQTSCDEKMVVQWANRRVQLAAMMSSDGPSTFTDFKDKSLADGVFLLDLLAAISPGALNPALRTAGETSADRKNNARYVISVARKIGATVFCTWEDIVEVRPKMMTALMACLMALDRKKQKGFKKEVRCLARKRSVEIDSSDASGSETPTSPASSIDNEQNTQDMEQPQQPETSLP